MKLTHVFKQLKKEYLAIQPSELLREHGWNVLRQRMEEEEKGRGMRRAWMFLASVILLVILGGAGTVYAAQSAKPGDVLYPVKVASQRVARQIAPILNRPEVEHKEVTPRPTEKVEQLKETIDAVTKEKDQKKEEKKEEKKDTELPVKDVEVPRDVPVTVPSAVPSVIPPIPPVGL